MSILKFFKLKFQNGCCHFLIFELTSMIRITPGTTRWKPNLNINFHYRDRLFLKFFKFKNQNDRHFWSYANTVITLNEQNHVRNHLLQTKSKYKLLQNVLRRYVNFKVFKFKMTVISSFLKVRQNRDKESDKEKFGENSLWISLF